MRREERFTESIDEEKKKERGGRTERKNDLGTALTRLQLSQMEERIIKGAREPSREGKAPHNDLVESRTPYSTSNTL